MERQLAIHPSGELPAVEYSVLESGLVEQRVDREEAPRSFLRQLLKVELPGEEGSLALVRKVLPPGERALVGERGAVLFIHGFAQNRYTWHTRGRSLPNFLASLGYDTYNVDLRGQGRSRRLFKSPLAHHPDDYIERDVPAVVSALLAVGGSSQVTLIGHSLGGAVSYAVAPRLHRAGVLGGVVAIAALFGFGTNGFVRQLCRVGWNFARTQPKLDFSVPLQLLGGRLSPFLPALDRPWTGASPFHGWYPGTVEPDVLEHNVGEGLDQVSLGVVLALSEWAIEGYIRSRDGADYVAPFQQLTDVPVLVLTGAEDVLLTHQDAAQAVRWAGSRDVTWRVFSFEHGGHGWGHLDIILGRDAPRYVWAEIATWLERIEA